MTAEHFRLEAGTSKKAPLEEVGAVPQRAPVGNRARGLQRRRRRLELLHPRPGPLARLPLGRGRPGRHLRRPAAALLRAGPVERQGPDPQGTPVRPDQQREQSRRGRQGILLLPRQHADPFVHEVPLQVSAGGLPVRRPGRDEPRPEPATSSSTSCSTRASSTRIATSTCSSSMPRNRPRTSSSRSRVHNRGPEPAELHVLPTLWFRNQWSWHGERRPADAAAGRRRPAMRASSRRVDPELGERYLYCEGDVPLLFTENETNTQRIFGVAQPHARTSRTASTTTSSTARQEAVNPEKKGTKVAAHYRLTVEPGEMPGRSAAAHRRRVRPTLARGNGQPTARSAATSTRCCEPAARRPTSSTRPSSRRRSTPTRPTSCGRRWRACCGASSSTTTTWTSGSKSAAPTRSRRRARRRRATTTGTTCTTATSSRCRTSGSIPGTRPGTSPSTCSP